MRLSNSDYGKSLHIVSPAGSIPLIGLIETRYNRRIYLQPSCSLYTGAGRRYSAQQLAARLNHNLSKSFFKRTLHSIEPLEDILSQQIAKNLREIFSQELTEQISKATGTKLQKSFYELLMMRIDNVHSMLSSATRNALSREYRETLYDLIENIQTIRSKTPWLGTKRFQEIERLFGSYETLLKYKICLPFVMG